MNRPDRPPRRSQLRSTRGHVRLEQRPTLPRRILWGAGIGVGLVVLVLVVRQFVLPSLDEEKTLTENRTWLDVDWTQQPEASVRQLADRLKSSRITAVYLEAGVWYSDGSFQEVQNATAFAQMLRTAYPGVKILLWLREVDIDKISAASTHNLLVDLARKAVKEWQLDGIQLQGSRIANGSNLYLQMLRDLRQAIGSSAILSVTVPADRIPTNPNVPVGPEMTDAGDLTWDMDYKQGIGMLLVDEVVIMAHASSLTSAADYQKWVAYQVDSYADVLGKLSNEVSIIVALPTYSLAPGHDPAVESLDAGIKGVKAGIKDAKDAGQLVKGIALYVYKETEPLEWTQFQEAWLSAE